MTRLERSSGGALAAREVDGVDLDQQGGLHRLGFDHRVKDMRGTERQVDGSYPVGVLVKQVTEAVSAGSRCGDRQEHHENVLAAVSETAALSGLRMPRQPGASRR